MANRPGIRVIAALVAVQFCYGINYLGAKLVVPQMTPKTYTMLRIWGGMLILGVAVRAMGRRFPTRRGDLARLALYALFGVVLNQWLFAEGIRRTTPIHSSLINTTIPIATLTIAVLLGRERGSWRRVAATLLGLAGAWLVIASTSGGTGQAEASVLGDLFTAANATSFALFLVISRPLMQRLDPLAATAVLLAFGAVGISLIAAPELNQVAWSKLTPALLAWLAFAMIFPTALAYLLQYWALTRVESSTVAFFIYLQPTVAATLSVLVLNEPLSWPLACGATLIFGAVGLAQTRTAKR